MFYFRSRRKATAVRIEQKRIRIRPCLSVCQTVEQICPYLLPADRAPAYPTQYAGEPTFLCLGEYSCALHIQVKSLTRYNHHHHRHFHCSHFYSLNFSLSLSLSQFFLNSLSSFLFLDPNIDETGNQLYKSNNGPSECCYDYCKFDGGLCSSTCDAIFNRNNETANIASSSSAAKITTTTTTSYVDNYDDIDNDDGESTSKQARTNETNSPFIPNRGPYVKLDNGTVVLNDFSHMPQTEMGITQCPAIIYSLPNVTQSAQQCSISQAQVSSTANCNSSLLSISILLLLLLLSHYYPTTSSIALLSLFVVVWTPLLHLLPLLLQQLVATIAVIKRSTTRKIIVTGS
jgi:hypothetical protein